MQALRSENWLKPVLQFSISPESRKFLNHLRFVSMKCRSKPRTELFEACALLHVTRNANQQAHAEALMRCLNEALGKQARLYSPGVVEMTFDESWLVQLGMASARMDDISVEFLLKSRVAHQHQRQVRFLVHRISEYFYLN